MKRAQTVTLSADKIPDAAKEALIEYRAQGESAWRGIASLTADMIAEVEAKGARVNKAALYATIGALSGRASNTVRQWVGVYVKVEDLIGDYQVLTFDHWRVLLAHAKRTGDELRDVAERALQEAEAGGYADPSVDVLTAILAEGGIERLDAPRSVKTLDRVGRAVIAHDKALRMPDAGVQHGQREAWATVKAMMEDYAGKYGAQQHEEVDFVKKHTCSRCGDVFTVESDEVDTDEMDNEYCSKCSFARHVGYPYATH